MTVKAILVPILLASSPAPAEPSLRQRMFCAELERIVSVAALGGDFTDLQRSQAAPPRLGFNSCQAGTPSYPEWFCHQNLAPDALSLASLSAATSACLPDAVRTSSTRNEAVFTLPHARIRISEYGGPRAHVGRIVSYRVERVEEEIAR